jgi:DNA repair exonuclease SbcCD ATPase subunit
VSEYFIKFNNELNNQKLMDQTIEADKRMIERCEESIMDSEKELERLRLAWPNRKFSVDGDVNVCPTCGQPLPADVVEGKIETLRQNFNAALEAEKQSLRDKAAKVKKDKEDAEKELETTKQKLVTDTSSLGVIKENINTIFFEKAKEEKKPLPTLDDFLPCNEEYQEALREKTNLECELNSVTDSDDNKEMLADLREKREKLVQLASDWQTQLATRQQYDKITSLIKGINEEQKDLVKQLSELEKQEDVARQYQFRQNQLLEERINKHFSLVQWRLFRTVNNGGDSFEEPFCECYVNGIPYHAGLNQASRLNAGLDIINALCKFYNVAAPICLDNSESCINIMQTAGQQVRLQVTDTDLQLV